MGEFDSLAIGGKHHGVIADDIATAQGVHADFLAWACADVANAAVSDVVLVAGVGFLVEDFQQAACGSGWRIDLVAVVHFRDFDVEAVIAKDLGSFAGEVEEGVYSYRKVRGENDGEFL